MHQGRALALADQFIVLVVSTMREHDDAVVGPRFALALARGLGQPEEPEECDEEEDDLDDDLFDGRAEGKGMWKELERSSMPPQGNAAPMPPPSMPPQLTPGGPLATSVRHSISRPIALSGISK